MMISQRAMLVALLCAAWILPGLIGHDPWKPDEAHTFGVVYELLRGGSWVVPTLAGEPFLDKPPLFHLTAAAFAKLFSFVLPLHDAARLATGAWMAATFAFIAVAGRELYSVRYGAVSALLLLGCFGFVVRGHQLITDAALLAGFAMAYYGFALALRRPAVGGFWIGTGVGVGFLAHGLFAPAVLGMVALLLPASGRNWRNRGYGTSLAVAAAAAAPWLTIWPILLERQAPTLFEWWLWNENLWYYFGRQPGARAGLLFYLRILPWYAFPVWLLALWTLWRARGTGLTRPAVVLPVIGFIVTLGTLSASSETRELHAFAALAARGGGARNLAPWRGSRVVLVQRHDFHLLRGGLLVLLERTRARRAGAAAPAPAPDTARLHAGVPVAALRPGRCLLAVLARGAGFVPQERGATRRRVGRGRDDHVGADRHSLRRLGRQREELPLDDRFAPTGAAEAVRLPGKPRSGRAAARAAALLRWDHYPPRGGTRAAPLVRAAAGAGQIAGGNRAAPALAQGLGRRAPRRQGRALPALLAECRAGKAVRSEGGGASRGFEKCACAHLSRRTPDAMQRVGPGSEIRDEGEYDESVGA
jgi:hypothetical protein